MFGTVLTTIRLRRIYSPGQALDPIPTEGLAPGRPQRGTPTRPPSGSRPNPPNGCTRTGGCSSRARPLTTCLPPKNGGQPLCGPQVCQPAPRSFSPPACRGLAALPFEIEIPKSTPEPAALRRSESKRWRVVVSLSQVNVAVRLPMQGRADRPPSPEYRLTPTTGSWGCRPAAWKRHPRPWPAQKRAGQGEPAPTGATGQSPALNAGVALRCDSGVPLPRAAEGGLEPWACRSG